MRWLWLVVLLVSCSGDAPDPQSITKIVLSRRVCDSACHFAQYVFYPNGDVDFTTGLHFTIHARLSKQSYEEIASWLVRAPAFGPRWNYVDEPTQEPSTDIWTEYAGRHAQVTFPTEDPGSGPVSQLTRWSSFAATEADGAVMREREKTSSRLRRFERLERVVFRSNGCFGTCPAYIVAFFRSGNAIITNVRHLRGVNVPSNGSANAHVPFDRVVTLLRESGFSLLDPEYELRTEDVYGVAFEFDYSDGFSYVVQAPDRTQWPPAVAELVGAFGQLIDDTIWQSAR